MTIAITWIRKVRTVEELVMVTDSRLSFGCRWDCCPKIIALPRGDSAICFAGDTLYAYPILLQFINSIEQHPKVKSRALDIIELKGHLLRVMNNMTSQISDLPVGMPNQPETNFLLAGWSWRTSRYYAWLLHFDPSIKRFTFRPTTKWRGNNNEKFLAFTGDYENDFKEQLIALLREKGNLNMVLLIWNRLKY